MKVIEYIMPHKDCKKCKYIREALWRVLNHFRLNNGPVQINMAKLSKEQQEELIKIHKEYNIPAEITESSVSYGKN